MEALYTIIGLAMVLGLLWGISHYAFRVVGPRRNRTRVLGSLQEATVIGDSDIATNITAAAKRWINLKRGVTDCKELRLEQAQEDIKQQLLVLQPYAEQLDQRERELKGRGATLSNIGDVLNMLP